MDFAAKPKDAEAYLMESAPKSISTDELLFEEAGERSRSSVAQVTVKKLEVGQGAKIIQRLFDDPNGIEFWRNEPEAIVYINYCLEEDAVKIIEAGEVDFIGKEDGFLDGIPKSI